MGDKKENTEKVSDITDNSASELDNPDSEISNEISQSYNDELTSKLGHNPETHRAYTVEDYFQDMSDILEGRTPKGAPGVPRPRFDVSGLQFLLMIPFKIFWVFAKDPFTGWGRRRYIGLGISVAVILVAFILSVAIEVLFRLGEEHFIIDSLLNLGSFGLIGFLVFIWPRTFVLILLLAIVISVISWIFSLIPI